MNIQTIMKISRIVYSIIDIITAYLSKKTLKLVISFLQFLLLNNFEMFCLKLFVVCLFFCSIGICCNIKGVNPKECYKYSNKTLNCGGKLNKIISIDKINDDYCDCLETGFDEPGTSACNNGKFWCKSYKILNIGQYIFSSWINDGKCDCCDGSDEWNINCINDCIDNKNNYLNIDINNKKAIIIPNNYLFYDVKNIIITNNKDKDINIEKFLRGKSKKNQIKKNIKLETTKIETTTTTNLINDDNNISSIYVIGTIFLILFFGISLTILIVYCLLKHADTIKRQPRLANYYKQYLKTHQV